MSPRDEQAIIRLITDARSGDNDALGRLLEQHRNYLRLLADIQIGQRLQGKADASDVVQDTFLEVHRCFPRFEGETAQSFLSWLRHTLAGQVAHLVRRYCTVQARDVRLEHAIEQELDSSSDALSAGLLAGHASPSEEAARRERAVLLADALSRIPPDYRDAIVLRQLEGLSFADVAARMGRSVDSVQKLWVRALERLREELKGQV